MLRGLDIGLIDNGELLELRNFFLSELVILELIPVNLVRLLWSWTCLYELGFCQTCYVVVQFCELMICPWVDLLITEGQVIALDMCFMYFRAQW